MKLRTALPLSFAALRGTLRRALARPAPDPGRRSAFVALATALGTAPVLAAPPARRPAGRRAGGGVTVTDYGGGDDDAMFAQALAEAEAEHRESGRKVAFTIPPGSYDLRRTLDFRVPMQVRGHGAVVNQGIRQFGMGSSIEGLTISGAPNFGMQLHRGQGAVYTDITIEKCGGAGLMLGGLWGSQVAWSSFRGIRLLKNAGGLSIGTSDTGLPVSPWRPDEQPSLRIDRGGQGYPDGTALARLRSGENGRGAFALVTVTGGAVRSIEIAHSGTQYRLGEQLIPEVPGYGDGAVFTVTALQDDGAKRKRNWCNANTFDGLWVRENQRFAMLGHGSIGYNTMTGTQAEANDTRDLAVLEGEWALTKFFGGHIVGGGRAGLIGSDVPVVRIMHPGRGNQYYGVRFVQFDYAGAPSSILDLPRSDILINPEYVSAQGPGR